MKKHYKLTPEERTKHEQAVKLRKMTDEQICEYIGQLQEKNIIPAEIPEIGKVQQKAVEDFLSDVSTCCKGIGLATIAKLRGFAKGDGFIS